jgi:hypothetical protein
VDVSQFTDGKVLFWVVLISGMMVAYPFAKAVLVWLAIRMVKFQNVSYWRSFYCVLIGIGATMAVQMIFLGIALQPERSLDPVEVSDVNSLAMFFGLLLAVVAETISLLLFFKEPLGKTIGAVALTHLLAIVLFVVLILSFAALAFLIALITG